MSTTPPSPPGGSGQGGAVPGGSSITLQVTVDTATGTLQIKNFGAVLQGLGAATAGAGNAAGKAGNQAQASALGWLALYEQTKIVTEGIIAYAYAVKNSVIEATYYAAATEKMNTVLRLTATNMNISTGAAEAQVQSIQRLGITHQEAIATTTQFIRAQLNLTDASKLARAAQDLAVVSGQNSSEALGTLTEAIQTNREMLLRQFGIVATLPQIFDLYAAKINKSAGALTQHEREQAILNTILTQANRVTGAYTAAMDDAGKAVTSLARYHQEAQEAIGKGFVPIMLLAVRATMNFLGAVKDFANAHATFVVFIGSFAAMATAITTAMGAVKGLQIAYLTLSATLKATGAIAAETSVLMASLPYIGIAVAIAAIGAAFITWTAAVEGANKALVENAQKQTGQLEQARNLTKAYQDLIVEKQKLADLDSGKTPVKPPTEGVISADLMKRLQLTAQARAIQADTNILLQQAKDLGLSITEQDILSGDAKKKIADYQKQQNEAAGNTIENLKKQIDDLTPKLLDAQKRVANMTKDVNKGAPEVEQIGPRAVPMIPGQDELKSAQEDADKLKKAIDAAKDALKGLQSQMNGEQTRPIDMELAAVAISKVTGLMQTLEQERHMGMKTTQQSAELERQYAGAVTGQIQSIIDNYNGLLAKQEGLAKNDPLKLRPAEIDAVHAYNTAISGVLKKFDDATSKGTLTAGQMNNALQAASKGLAQAGESAKVLPMQLTMSLDTMLNLRKQTDGMIEQNRRLGAEQLQPILARRQAELAVLEAQSKTNAEVAHTYDLQRQIATLQQRIADQGDVVAANNARIAKGAADIVRDVNQQRAAWSQIFSIQQIVLTADQQRHQLEGVDLQQQITDVENRYTIERNQIRDTADNAEKISAQLHAKQVAEEVEITNLRRKNFQDIQELYAQQFTEENKIATARTRNAADELAMTDKEVENVTRAADARALAIRNNEAERARLMAQGLTQVQAQNTLERQAQMLTADADKQIWDLRFTRQTAFLQMKQQELVVTDQIAVAEGRMTAGEAQAREATAALAMKALELLHTTQLTTAQVKAQTDAMQRQIDFQRQMDQMEIESQKLKTAQNIGGMSRQEGAGLGISPDQIKAQFQQIEGSLSTFRTEVAEAAQELMKATPGTEQYTQALEKLTKAQSNLNSAMQSLTGKGGGLSGLVTALTSGQMVSGLTKLTDVFQEAGNAINTMFDAMMHGQSAGLALQQFISSTLATIAKQQVVLGMVALAQAIWDAASPFGDKAAAGPEFASAGMHFAAAALAGAGAAATSTTNGGFGGGSAGGGGVSGGGSSSNPSSQGPPSPGGQQTMHPIATKTDVGDSIVRVANAVMYQGAEIAAQGEAYKNVSLQMVKALQGGSFYQPVLNAAANVFGQKVAAAQQTQSPSATATISMLSQIHNELVKANDMAQQGQAMSMEVSLDGPSTSAFLGGQIVKNSRSIGNANLNSNQANGPRRDNMRALAYGSGV